MKQKLIALVIGISLLSPFVFVATTSAITCPAPTKSVTYEKKIINGVEVCVAGPTQICPAGQNPAEDAPNSKSKYVCCPAGTENNATECFFQKYINPTVKLLTALAGVMAVLGISIGGIQYAASGGDPQKVSAGKAKITKALFGLAAFMFLFSALQFMSPGGFSANPKPVGGAASASACSKTFFGLKPWFAYLPATKFDANCQIKSFNLLPSEGSPSSTKDNTSSDVLPVAVAIVDNLVRIAALVAIVFVVIGGVKYVTSQGEPEGIKSAKDSIINALIGLVVAIIAAAVVSFIGNQLT